MSFGCYSYPGDVQARVDADTQVDAIVDAAIDAVPGTWSSPVKLAFNRQRETEECPSISNDGLELYFTGLGWSEAGGYDIYSVTRPDTRSPWGTARGDSRGASTPGNDEFGPNLDSTATELFFESSGTLSSITRVSATSPWSGSPITLGFQGRFPNVSSDGLTLYYLDTTASCPAGTCRSKRTRADRLSNWGTPSVEQMSFAQFSYAFVSGDGRRVLFSGPPANTIAEASRQSTDMPWGATRAFGGVLNSFYQYARWNSAEDEMYLAAPGFEQGTYDVYQSTLQRP